MNSLELFAGAGGLSLGLEEAGWNSKLLIEKDKHACNTLRYNKDKRYHLAKDWNIAECDVREVNYKNVQDRIDLVAGGPPCQPFSLGGAHKGENDARDMFPEAIRAVRDLHPKYFLFENVKGLLRKSFDDYFQYIILRLKYPFKVQCEYETWQNHSIRLQQFDKTRNSSSNKYFYRVSYELIDAADYGIPQHRHRIIIIGVREDQDWKFEFPKRTHFYDKLIYSKYISKNYWSNLKIPEIDDEKHYKNIATQIKRLGLTSPFIFSDLHYKTVYEAIRSLPFPTDFNKNYPNHVLKLGAKPYPGHTGSLLHFPSKAIKAGRHGVPGGENMIAYPDGTYRYYSTREAARIQTFPDDYVFTGSWTESMRQIGNAVPVQLGFLLGKTLLHQANQKQNQNVKKHKRTLQSA